MENTYKRLPVSLLTGFLGSGKTTLLNALLRDPAMAGAAVIINEVGEVGIDHLIVEHIDEQMVLLESGCICCTLRGDLSRSLRELFMRRLRGDLSALTRVVIETTGLADPAPVIHTLIHDFFLAPRFVLDGVITTADVGHVCAQVDEHEAALKQIAMADALVLTKSDLASAEQIALARNAVCALNPTARCLTAPVSVAELFALNSAFDPNKSTQVLDWLNESAAQAQQARVKQSGVFGAFGANAPAVVHDQRISTQVLRFTKPLAWGDFSEALDMLQTSFGERLLRVKGLVNVQGEAAPRVIHAVQHERYPSENLAAWPDEDHDTRLVFIVNDLPRAVLEKAFDWA